MAKPFIDEIIDDIADRTGGALSTMTNMVEQDSQQVLLRRFRRSYPMLSVEETIAIQNTLGHTAGEDVPCKVCRIMATEEFRLSQEQD